MSDASLTTPTDKATIPQHLSDAEVGNAVANKFLNEVHTALTGTTMDANTYSSQQDAWTDLSRLQGDPQQGAVLNAIATKIDNHDPALGVVQGTVERDKNGDITGFSFENPEREAQYQTSLNQAMAKGETLKEAIADDGTNLMTVSTVRGKLDMPASGTYETTSFNPPADTTAAPSPQPAADAAPAPHYQLLGQFTIPG